MTVTVYERTFFFPEELPLANQLNIFYCCVFLRDNEIAFAIYKVMDRCSDLTLVLIKN